MKNYLRASNRLMDEMSKMNDVQIDFKPTADDWNMAQVMNHLQKVELGVITQILYYNQSTDKKFMQFKNYYRTFLLVVALYLPKKYKVPVKAIMPEEEADKAVILMWENQQKQWINNPDLKPMNQKQVVFKHPIAGYINMTGAFNFLRAHLNHHLIQVSALKIHKSFPKA